MSSSTITVVVVLLALAGVVAFVLMSGSSSAALPARVAGAVGLSTTTQSGFVASPESFHQGEVIS